MGGWWSKPIMSREPCFHCREVFEFFTDGQIDPPLCRKCLRRQIDMECWLAEMSARSQDDYLEKLKDSSMLSEFSPAEESAVDWWNAIGRRTEDAIKNEGYRRSKRAA